MKNVLAKEDLAGIIDLKLVAYGNTKENADSTWTCQHGAEECETDATELCLQYKLSNDLSSIESGDTAFAAWPFILCMEEADGDPSKGQSCFDSTMSNSTVTWNDIKGCMENDYDNVMKAAKNATPNHDYVPWVLVDGNVLDNTQLLQKAVCDAYTGIPPQSCRKGSYAETASAESVESRCYPKTT